MGNYENHSKKEFVDFGAFMPVRLKFNGEYLTTLYGSQERTLPIPIGEGQLEYKEIIGRSSHLQ